MTFKLKQSLLIFLFMLFSSLSFAQKTYQFIKSEKVSGGQVLSKPFELLTKSSQIRFTLPSYSGEISYFENNIAFPTVASELSTSFGVYQTERALPTYKFELIISDSNPATIVDLNRTLFGNPKADFKNLIKVSKPYNFQGLKAVTVSLSPFRLEKGKLITCKEATVQLKKNSIYSGLYPLMHQDFLTIAKQTFINFEPAKINPKPKPTKLVIITTEQLVKSGILEPFAKSKENEGLKTEVFIYPNETGAGIEPLKNFISKQKNITHLMLCASPEDIPTQTFYTLNSRWYKTVNWHEIPFDKKKKLNKGVTSDQYYTGVDPTIQNYIPDFFVSRIPLSKPKDVKKMLDRIINQKTKHKGHILAIASDEDNRRDLSDQTMIERLVTKYKHVKFNTLFQKNQKLSEAIINASLNQQPTLTIYQGHGFTDHWQTGKYYARTETKPTIFFQPVCQTGALFTQSMAAQQCRVNAIGVFASTNNCYTSVSSTLTQLTIKAMNSQKFTTMGGLLFSSTIDLALRCKALAEPDLESGYISLQFNYFGDASMSTTELNLLFTQPKK